MPRSKENGGMGAVTLPFPFRILAWHSAPNAVRAAMNTSNGVERKLVLLVYLAEHVEAEDVQVEEIFVLLEISEFESQRYGAYTLLGLKHG